MKKIFLIILLIILFSSPFVSMAAGLVPCGTERDAAGNITNPCQFCHFFVLFNNIVNFVLLKIVPSLAVLMIVIGGFLFFFAGQDPAMLNRAKSIFTSVAWGLLIVFGAWIVVNTFFAIIGITSWTGEWLKFPGAWFQIDCPIK